MARWPPLPNQRRAARWGFSRVFIYKFFLFFGFVPFFFFFFFFINLIKDFCVPNDFANRHAVELNINLVNKESLDNILRAKVFVHNDGQL